MRILQLTSHLNIGGISRHILSISRPLAQRGHEVIVASDHGNLESQLAAIPVAHWPLPLHVKNEFSPQILLAVRNLKKKIAQCRPDILHAHTRVGQVVAERIWQDIGIPYVTTWHGIYRRNIGRRLWPCAGKIAIAISRQVEKHLQEDFGVPQEKIRCIYNGIDTDHYSQPPDPETVLAYQRQFKIPTGVPLVGGIGRLAAGKVKGFDLLLIASYLLAEKLPDLHVLIVGDGPRRPFLEEIAGRLRIRHRICFAGSVQDVRIPLALMDVFVFPSRWPEAFGLTLVEAMASGKPVVATEVGAVPEIVRQRIDGVLVPVEDPEALAKGILEILQNPTLASELARTARTRARETFGLPQMVASIEAAYREAAALPPSR